MQGVRGGEGYLLGKECLAETERQGQCECEKQDWPPGHSERSVFVSLSSKNNSAFVIKPAWRTGEAVISAASWRPSAPEAAPSMKGKRKAAFPSLHLDGLAVQVPPCRVRDTCHPTIWPRRVRIQGIRYASCCPHPRLIAQLGAV